jgi:hypothetical protein
MDYDGSEDSNGLEEDSDFEEHFHSIKMIILSNRFCPFSKHFNTVTF